MSDTKPRYRLVRSGEVLQKGDEHLNDDAETWREITHLFVGIPYMPVFQPVRRKVEQVVEGDAG